MAPLLLSALSILSGAAYIWSTDGGTQLQRYLLKPLTTGLILAVALTVPDPVSALYRGLVAIGILFSMGGDILLMLSGSNFFLFGLVSFLIAHLFYVTAYWSRSGFHLTPWLLAPYALYTAALLFLLWPHVGAMRVPVVIYGLVLMVMGWQAAEQWWLLRETSALLAMIGAALFLLSDSILALDRFRAPIQQRDLLVMTTYYAALLFIAWSVQRTSIA